MKKIEAIIRQSKLEEVIEELNRHQIYGMTVTQVMGCGRQKGRIQCYRGNEYNVNLHPKIKLEMVVKENWVEEIVQAVMKIANTGKIGDGKIFIYSVEDACRIRTGERGTDAIL